MKVRILGSGTSSGVPRLGNDWGTCDPADPRNRRTRVSILVESATTRILVDTSPDMRDQLLAARVDGIDAVLWTHDHADHCHGLDDLRQLFQITRRTIQGYADARTLDSLRNRFSYVFQGNVGYPAIVEADVVTPRMTIGDIAIMSVDQPHGAITSLGFRFETGGKSVSYATDCDSYTPEMIALYQATDVLIADALRRRPHPSHAHLAATLEAIGQIKPGRALLTHMDNSMDYATLCQELPAGVAPAYDGLEIDLS